MYIKRYKNKIVLHDLKGMWTIDLLTYNFKKNISDFILKLNIITNKNITADDVLNININGKMEIKK